MNGARYACAVMVVLGWLYYAACTGLVVLCRLYWAGCTVPVVLGWLYYAVCTVPVLDAGNRFSYFDSSRYQRGFLRQRSSIGRAPHS